MSFEKRLKKRMKALQHLGRNMAKIQSDAIYLANIQRSMDEIHYLHSVDGSCEKCPLWRDGCVKYIIESMFAMMDIKLKPAPKEIIRTYSEENWHGLER